MKNVFLLVFSFTLSFSSMAQSKVYERPSLPEAITNLNLEFTPFIDSKETVPLSTPNPILSNTRNYRSTISTIGETTYDLQSNNSVQNRIYKHSNGNISAIWTSSGSGTLAAPDRGTGYNHFDGNTWMLPSSTRIESVRTGWPSMASGTTNSEIIVNHNFGTNPPLNLISRPTSGSGAWTTSTISGVPSGELVAWPRAVIGGSNNNTVHLIAVTMPTGNGGTIYNGLDGAILYSRSPDGGITWDIQHSTPPGMNTTNYFSNNGDSYAIDAKGDVVAFVSGGFTQDFAMWKSTDNGGTWTRTPVLPFPLPAFTPTGNITDIDNDGIADTLDSQDGSVAILIDNNNIVHVWVGAMRVLKTDPAAAGVSYFPGTDGLLYWNESMGATPPIVIASAADVDGNGSIDILGIANYQLGLTTMPNAAIDNSGNLFCVYTSVVENTTNGLIPPQSYRNVYVVASNNGGMNWTNPFNISDSDFDEGVFASIARKVDNDIHVIWQSDTEPGLAVRGDLDPFGLNQILYSNTPTSLLVGIDNPQSERSTINIFPNPASTWISMSVKISDPGIYDLKIINSLGQIVRTENINFSQTGNHQIGSDISDLRNGMHFFQLSNKNGSQIAKFIVN